MDLFYAFVCLCPSPFTCLSLPRALTISTCPSSLCLPRLLSPSHPICINFSISVPPPTGHLPIMIMFKSHSTALRLFPPPYLYRIIATLCLGVFTSCHSMSWLFHYVFPERFHMLYCFITQTYNTCSSSALGQHNEHRYTLEIKYRARRKLKP